MSFTSFQTEEQQALLKLSRRTLEAAFEPGRERQSLLEFEALPVAKNKAMGEHLPCFVTLRKLNGRLRGCIGSMRAFNPLYINVFQMTRQAAFEDPRFRPMISSEVTDTKISISVLGPLQPLTSLEGLQLGNFGLHVSFRGKAGVLLASVAVENHFTKERFLAETCVKAGLDPLLIDKYEIKYFEEIHFQED